MKNFTLVLEKGEMALLRLERKKYIDDNNLTDKEGKVLPEYKRESSIESQDRAEKIMNEFKENLLFDYLSNIKNPIIEKSKDGFAPHSDIIAEAGEHETNRSSVILEAIIKRLKEYKNWDDLPPSVSKKMIRYLFKSLSHPFMVKTTKTEIMETVGSEKGLSIDVKELNKVLLKFTTRGKSASLTYKKVIEGDFDISNVVFKGGNVSHRELKQWKRVIESQRFKIKTRLNPILSLIDGRLRTGEKIIHLETDYLIGELSLQSATRREAIYKYWDDINTKTFEEFKEALKVMQEAFEIFEGNDEIHKLIKTFNSFEGDDLNYIVEVKSMHLKDYFEKDKGLILFEEFLEEAGLSKITDEEKLIEERSSVPQWKEEITDKTTGETKTFLEMGEDKPAVENLNRSGTIIRMPDGSTRITGEARKILTKLGIELEELSNEVEVDPLFYHAFTKEKGIFKNTVMFANQFKKIEREMLSGGRRRESITGIDIDDDILEYLAKLEDLRVSSPQETYHLPLSETLKKFIIGENAKGVKLKDSEINIDDRLKKIGIFLETVTQFLDAGKDLQRSAAPSVARTRGTSGAGHDSSKTPTINTIFAGRQNTKNYLEEMEEVKVEWDAFLETVIEFFVIPISSKFKPFDDKFPFDADQNTQRTFRMLAGVEDSSAFFKLLILEGRQGYLLVGQEDLQVFVNLLEYLTAPTKGKDIGEIRNHLRKTIKRVNWILGAGKRKPMALETNIEFGEHFHRMLEKNNIEPQEFNGKTSKEWHELYREDTVYPFEAIISHLKRNRAQYSDSRRTQVKGKDKQKKGSNTLVQRFFTALDGMKTLKSLEEQKMLEAHDIIRKMMNKPIYYNTSKTDNFNHVDKALEILLKKYNVDLSAYELENIVFEINSMESIGKEYGIPTESVYFLKANFR